MAEVTTIGRCKRCVQLGLKKPDGTYKRVQTGKKGNCRVCYDIIQDEENNNNNANGNGAGGAVAGGNGGGVANQQQQGGGGGDNGGGGGGGGAIMNAQGAANFVLEQDEKIESLENDKEEMKEEIKAKDEEIEELTNDVTRLEGEKEEAERERDEEQDRVGRRDRRIRTLKQKRRLADAIAQKRIETLEREAAAQTATIETLEREKADWARAKRVLEEKMAQQRANAINSILDSSP